MVLVLLVANGCRVLTTKPIHGQWPEMSISLRLTASNELG